MDFRTSCKRSYHPSIPALDRPDLRVRWDARYRSCDPREMVPIWT